MEPNFVKICSNFSNHALNLLVSFAKRAGYKGILVINISSYWRCSMEKGVLKNFANFTRKHLCQGLFFNTVPEVCNLIKKETLAKMFFLCILIIFKNTLFAEHRQTNTS